MGLLRRELVSASIAVALVTPTPSTVTLTFDAAVDILRNRCPSEFLEAVRDTGAFLYRGEPGAPAILAPRPDLLEFETYGSRDAVRCFANLERQLKNSAVRPSTGHIGVARRAAAERWGPAASVWPLGVELHYVVADGDFFGASGCAPRVRVDAGLRDALRGGGEVMIGGGYLALPAAWDERLRRALEIRSSRR